MESLLHATILKWAGRYHHPETVLVIGGQGISSDSLKRYVELHALADVIFTDMVSNSEKRALMQLSDRERHRACQAV